MARFRFALAKVLERRLEEEDVRRRALAAVEARRRGLEDALRARQSEIAAGRSVWRDGLVGEVDPIELRQNASAALALVRRAHRTVLELAALERPLARARAELVEAARARRALELLRERRLAAFLVEENRREQAQLDEFGTRIGGAGAPGLFAGAGIAPPSGVRGRRTEAAPTPDSSSRSRVGGALRAGTSFDRADSSDAPGVGEQPGDVIRSPGMESTP